MQDIQFKNKSKNQRYFSISSVGVHYMHPYHINGNNSTPTKAHTIWSCLWIKAHFGGEYAKKDEQRKELDKPPVSRQHIRFHFWWLVVLFVGFSSTSIQDEVAIWYFYVKTLNLKWTSSTRSTTCISLSIVLMRTERVKLGVLNVNYNVTRLRMDFFFTLNFTASLLFHVLSFFFG